MRISDWSSDVCSSDLEPLIEGTETSRTMLPESSTSYSQISSAPAAMTPSSKSVPLISNMPMKRLSLMGSEMSPSHNLNRSEEHTSELQSIMRHSYAVICLTTKKTHIETPSKSKMQ